MDLLRSPELFAVGLFLAVCGMAAAVWSLRRAAALPEAGGPLAGLPPTSLVRGELDDGIVLRLAAPPDTEGRGAVALHLLQAGYRSPRALTRYATVRALLAFVLPVPVYLLVGPRTLLNGLLVVLLMATLGYVGPAVWVRWRRSERIARMQQSLPNLLDMLVGCLEAGLGLDAALRRSTRELAPVAPALAKQLDMVNAELSAGVTRGDGMRHLVERTGLDELASLATVLTQAERTGTSVAEAIRAHAHFMRRQRALDAERRAAEVAPRLTVVMILFILPTLFVVLVGPAFIQVAERLLPTLSGGG